MVGPNDDPLASGGGFIGIYPFARSLGLRVTDTASTHVTLGNSGNTVMIFTCEGGGVYVNTRSVGKTGQVEQRGDGVYVQKTLARVIRPALKSGYTYKPPSSPGKCVVLDAGHGGKDPGAPSCLGYHEKTVNLRVAHKVAEILRRKGIKVVMTRDDDRFIELEERANVANRCRANLFVSIHADSAANSSAQGFTLYVARSASWSSQKAAKAITKSMGRVAQNGRSIRRADYRVLVNTRGPAVLIELGYLSNRQEAALLRSSAYQSRLAGAIASGIVEFL